MTTINDALRDVILQSVNDTLVNATLTIYSGETPVSADTPLAESNTVLVSHSIGGTLESPTFNVVEIAARGTVTFARVEVGGKIAQLIVNEDFTVNNVNYVQGGLSRIDSFSMSLDSGGS